MLRALAAALALTLGPGASAAGVPRASLQLPRVSASIPIAGAASLRAAAPAAAVARSAEVLARAQAAGLEAKAVAAEIAASADPEEALGRLVEMGALKLDELPGGANESYVLLSRLWDQSSSALIDESFEIDRALSIPSIKVRGEGVEYHVHALAHGRLVAPGRARVARLVGEIESRGETLYWEQNLPLHYGSAAGKEINDHDAGTAPVRAGPAAGGLGRVEARAVRAFGSALVYAPPAAAAAAALLLPVLPMALVLGAAALGAWLISRGFLPLIRLVHFQIPGMRLGRGHEETAALLRRESSLLRAAPDPRNVLRLFLPPGAAAGFDALAARSQAIADAARADAARAGARVVHILTGYAHAAHVAWALRDSRPGKAGGETRV